MRIVFPVLIAVLTMGSLAEAKTERIYSFKSGEWRGAAFKKRETGKFSHCAIVGTYVTGRQLIFAATAKLGLTLLVRDRAWKAGNRKKYSVVVHVDRTSLGERTAVSVKNDTVAINFGRDDRVIERFRHGRVLKIRAAQNTFRFKLTGTARALVRMKECVQTATALAPRDAVPDRRKSSNPFAAQRRSLRDRASKSPTAGRTRNATPLLRRILRAAGVREPRFFDPRKKWNLPRGTYGWVDDGVIGLHFAVDRKSRPARAPITDALAKFGGSCRENFATAVKPTMHTGAYGFTEGVGQCGGGANATAVYITGMSLEKSIFLFVHVGLGHEAFMAEAKAARFKEVLVTLVAGKP